MRVTIVGINYAPERTGIAPYTTAIARHFAREHDVTVLTGVPHYPEWTLPAEYQKWRSDEIDEGVRVIRLRHHVPGKPGVVGRAHYELSFATRAIAAGMWIPTDVVIAVVPPLFGAHAARLIARRHKVPYGVIVQDIMSAAAAQGGVAGASKIAGVASKVETAALRAATSVATIHPRMAEELHRMSGAEPAVIYNWTHVGHGTRTRSDARLHFGWRESQVIALHSGNMGAKQNLEVVVDAARVAEAEGSNVTFVLAGDGNQRSLLEQYASGCRNIAFMDGVSDDDYVDLLQAADVLLVNERPGMKEMSMPSKLTSYLRAGRPIVAATELTGTTGEFIRASGGGVVTPAGDADALYNNVMKVADDEVGAAAYIDAGTRFARERLTAEGALAAYDEWLSALSRR